ncbi:caffeine-induced death protein 2 domain-containing protein [Hirsutella rhossiliensis]|uniref:Caffeine-induced death protein 2 domain-containing protein n=1 Tax=Hirsutella rhossiliensis TaxID=111463 RepID=A0A9P8N9B1_9HYPO|nr:caffeine-induced death protein 2 domain-containing protein [Hirsutella rhossiliensis]KAH0968366.1 caffeine-induced death protein 2 domain-containing protein [Hirsutella rhossiliensis]
MTQPVNHPSLSPQFCFSSGTLREFLRLSRSSVDDSITQNLNALVMPAEGGFDPQSTSRRAWAPPSRQISPGACQSFKDTVLFPAWQARTEVLDYCGLVATSPDLDDPEAMIREVENQRDRERVVNERLDPYSGRFFPREARTQTLATLIRQECGVESVVRSRTWDVVQQRCAAPPESWEDAVGRWRDTQASSTRPSPGQ